MVTFIYFLHTIYLKYTTERRTNTIYQNTLQLYSIISTQVEMIYINIQRIVAPAWQQPWTLK